MDHQITASSGENKRRRDEDDGAVSDSLDAKRIRIRYDLLEILDDSEVAADRTPETEDLDSVMKSFEDEIVASTATATTTTSYGSFIPVRPVTVDLTSDPGADAQPDLGYLLGASDDELGLPPAFSSDSCSSEGEKADKSDDDDFRVSTTVAVGLDQMWGFDDDIPSYEFGISDDRDGNSGVSDFVALDGLFDYSDVLCAQSDFSDLSWQPESLPAL